MLKKWYEGEYVPHKNKPGSHVVIFGGSYKRHWTAALARILVEFWVGNWRFLITTAIAMAGVVAAYLHLQ